MGGSERRQAETVAPEGTLAWQVFRIYRTAVAVLWCGFPAAGYVWMEEHVAVEAVRGNAFEIAEPQLMPVLAIAGAGVLGLAALAVAYMVWAEPDDAPRAALLHDALLVGLLAGSVLFARSEVPAHQPGMATVAVALATGWFTAEAVVLARWIRKMPWGAALALAYWLCVLGLTI
jgi:hypothetical protein